MTQDTVKAKYMDPVGDLWGSALPTSPGVWWMRSAEGDHPTQLEVTSVISEKEVIYRGRDGWLSRAYSSGKYSWQKAVPTEEPPVVTPSAKKHSHYHKSVSHLGYIDVYRVLELYSVINPCLQHAIKKLLVAGGRGAGKDILTDVQEAIDSLERWKEMRGEDNGAK